MRQASEGISTVRYVQNWTIREGMGSTTISLDMSVVLLILEEVITHCKGDQEERARVLESCKEKEW